MGELEKKENMRREREDVCLGGGGADVRELVKLAYNYFGSEFFRGGRVLYT